MKINPISQNFIVTYDSKFRKEGETIGLPQEKLKYYACRKINKLIGSKLRNNIDLDQLETFLGIPSLID